MSVLRIDSHQHFWSLARGDYDWLTPDLTGLYRDFGPDDLTPLLAESNVQHTVLVQAAPTVAETRYMLDLAEAHSFIAGVVGWVDFDSSNDALEALKRLSQNGKLVGMRPMIQDIEDAGWMLNAEHDAVLQLIIDLGLTFDALVTTEHLPYLRTLASRYPELNIVVDHGAKPNIREQLWDPWAAEISEISERTNVYCKLSGLITEHAVGGSYSCVMHYANHLLASFGADRLMWGSDWPVLNLNGSYAEWQTACHEWLIKLEQAEQESIQGHCANRVYKLGLS